MNERTNKLHSLPTRNSSHPMALRGVECVEQHLNLDLKTVHSFVLLPRLREGKEWIHMRGGLLGKDTHKVNEGNKG